MKVKVLDAEIEVTIMAKREVFDALVHMLGKMSVNDRIKFGVSEKSAQDIHNLWNELKNAGIGRYNEQSAEDI